MTEIQIHKKIIVPLLKLCKKSVKALPTYQRNKALMLIKQYLIESGKYFKEKKIDNSGSKD